jgi:hypothetical protein
VSIESPSATWGVVVDVDHDVVALTVSMERERKPCEPCGTRRRPCHHREHLSSDEKADAPAACERCRTGPSPGSGLGGAAGRAL